MSVLASAEPEIFTAREVARAAGVPVSDVRLLLRAGEVPSVEHRYVTADAAVELIRILRAPIDGRLNDRRLFSAAPAASPRTGGLPFAASSALHGGLLAIMILVTSLGLRSAPTEQRVTEPARLVFLATPGPGGGGGGGGLRQPAPPPKARLKGSTSLRSPVTVVKRREEARPDPPKHVETPPPVPVAAPDPAPPPPPRPEPTPAVTAPVVSAPADDKDVAGVLTENSASTAAGGSGSDGGAGTGRGGGIGEGNGAGIGDGSTAGIGGGPYRPGAGVTPPSLLQEVKPSYTDEGRRRGVQGDVVMEAVVRADGSVGSLRVIRGLGAGLDQRAIDAVRQWRFSPARRYGTPVDVLVEVAVEFRLR